MFKLQHIVFFLALIFFGFSSNAIAQTEKAIISGIIKDQNNKPVEAASISLLGYKTGTTTDVNGYYKLEVPAGINIVFVISHIGFQTYRINLNLKPDESIEISKTLNPSTTAIDTFTLTEEQNRNKTITRISPKTITVLPSASGGVEAILKTLPGVSSNNELSSQYSVRGGNFDENLVYVNDIEIYRPFLIRSGQQEGLSFVNSDMVSSILFSAGGFEAKYGDKMSSVLDITYRKPRKFNATANLNLLGASFHTEGASKDYLFTYQLGVRQKSNQYLLGALETKGQYQPSFTDVQTFFTYDITDKLELNFLGNISQNKFRMVPENRQTEFGTVNEALRFTVYFDGQEIDQFNTKMGAFSGIYRPRSYLTLKFISSIFNSKESEELDIQGQYWLDELVKDLGSEEFGEVAFNRGVGTYLNHSRNKLDALVYNFEHKGYYLRDDKNILWGARIQRESIIDKLNTWTMIDSAGYAVPQSPADEIVLQEVVKTKINLNSFRYSGYVQNTWNWGDSTDYSLTAGTRAGYWDVNKQFVISPRINFSAAPNWKRDIVFKTALGYYNQPPFYRELRDLNGILNTKVKAQNSLQFVAGGDYNFNAWGRPFKFISEMYFKYITDLIPYEVDNVRIRYFADNNAKGYSTGIDFKVNGEFVKGTESWASLSFMQSREDILDDYYYEYYNSEGKKIIKGHTFNSVAVDSVQIIPGYIPRPTDQLVFVGLFFQDYLPMLPDFKMHLNFLFGTGLPFGPPTHLRYQAVNRMPSYRRVDVGFSYQIVSENKRPREKSPFRYIKDLWVSAEVFNLLQVNNTISYIWIKDAANQLNSVPNYLTPRLLNVKLIGKF